MAVLNSPTLLLAIFTALLAMAKVVNSAQVVSFNFTKFTPSSAITLGNAQLLDNGVVALISREHPQSNIGHAIYSSPITIWDHTTGNIASFVTSFSFVVENVQGYTPADGVVFFLAPTDMGIPTGATGGNLGLINSTFSNFVGVEFDDYINEIDPNYQHIGIDVNSKISLKIVKWNKVSGYLVKVSIIYDSLSNTLSVALTNNDGSITTIAEEVDLKAVLPSKVNVGFSASTSTGGVQKHDIHSWSFTSTLETSIKENMNLASYA